MKPEVALIASPQDFFVKPAPGWLDVVFAEVTAIMASPLQKYKFEPKVTQLKASVKLEGCDWRQALEVMLRVTTAHGVSWLIAESKCNTWASVDAILGRIPWKALINDSQMLVHVTAKATSGFSDSSKRLREALCKIADVKHVDEGAKLRFKIDLREERLRVTASLCGNPLFKRGYKAEMVAVAPLAEHHAAACARWAMAGSTSKASIDTVFVPFAGSGTLGFEAAIAISSAGPGSFKRVFACELFPCTPLATVSFIRRKLVEKLGAKIEANVFFSDNNAAAVATLHKNIVSFGSGARFEVEQGDFFAKKPFVLSGPGAALVLLNPPYGERVGKGTDIVKMYADIGTYMKSFGGLNRGKVIGACICPDETSWKAFLKELNAKAPETRHFTHGGEDVRVVRWTF